MTKVRHVKAVLFDWDGTLVDSLPVKVHNAGRLFQQVYGLIPDRVERAYRTHSGVPRRQLFDAILGEFGLAGMDEATFQNMSADFSAMNREALTEPGMDGVVRPGSRETLGHLLDLGCRLFVSSAADGAEVRFLADQLGMSVYFDRSGGEVLGSRTGFGKGRGHVEYICREYHLKPRSLLFIGDDLADIRLGREAGIFTVSLAGSCEKETLLAGGAQVVVNSLDELMNLPDVRFGK